MVVWFSAYVLVTISRDNLTAGLAGLCISFSNQITAGLNPFVFSSAELENYMVSVERIEEYKCVKPEDELKKEDINLPKDWPKEGTISFNGYSTRYRPGLDLVLQDISINIKGREKVPFHSVWLQL